MVVDSTLIAAAAAGIIVGFITYYCLVRFPAVDFDTLAKVIGLIFTGAAVTFIANNLVPNKDAFAVYVVGVLAGMVLYYIARAFNIGPTISSPS